MTDEKRLTPSQKKEQRRKVKDAHNNAKKARLLARPEFSRSPRVQADVPFEGKTPRVTQDPDSIMSCLMEWNRSQADRDGIWSWGQPRDWNEEDWHGIMHPNLCEFERLTWAEILAQETGNKKRHKKHHDMDVFDIIPEAGDRWLELGLEQYEKIFRFRLQGKPRLWGYKIRAKFFLIWWDKLHKIYPV